jgi:hypothetical protein
MTRRVYFNTEQTTTVVRKGYIEIDEDFTQVYESFSSIAIKIHSGNSWKLLFWMLSNSSQENGIQVSNRSFEKFNNFIKDSGADIISKPTYYRCVKELVEAGAITQVGKGHYYMNPYAFWKDDKNKRITFITDEIKDGGSISCNPSLKRLIS